jgi:hypothetical protein
MSFLIFSLLFYLQYFIYFIILQYIGALVFMECPPIVAESQGSGSYVKESYLL